MYIDSSSLQKRRTLMIAKLPQSFQVAYLTIIVLDLLDIFPPLPCSLSAFKGNLFSTELLRLSVESPFWEISHATQWQFKVIPDHEQLRSGRRRRRLHEGFFKLLIKELKTYIIGSTPEVGERTSAVLFINPFRIVDKVILIRNKE